MVEIEVQLPQDLSVKLSLTETWQFNLTKTTNVDQVKVNDRLGYQTFLARFQPYLSRFLRSILLQSS